MPEALQELTEEELSICKQPACVLGGFGLEYFPGNSRLVMNVCIFALFSHDLGKCTFETGRWLVSRNGQEFKIFCIL